MCISALITVIQLLLVAELRPLSHDTLLLSIHCMQSLLQKHEQPALLLKPGNPLKYIG